MVKVSDLIKQLEKFKPDEDVFMFVEDYDYTRFFKAVRFNDAGGKGVMFKGVRYDELDG